MSNVETYGPQGSIVPARPNPDPIDARSGKPPAIPATRTGAVSGSLIAARSGP